MRISRYINKPDPSVPVIHTDFLIIGGGIAGMFTALKASAFGQVTVLSKTTFKESNTGLAQGGIAAAVHEEDSPFLHLEDTLEAGAGLCDIDAVDVLVREGPERVRELIALGASFDMKGGEVSLTREGAHSHARILHAADATGEAIRIALVESCENNPRIAMWEDYYLVDILGDSTGRECWGAHIYDNRNQQSILCRTRAVILATGGAGQLYAHTTNPPVATADGMAAAFRMGAEICDMEFIQFHPTVLYSQDSQRLLISEAVRGEGGRLRNTEGECFMAHYHPLQELAPRDVVSRAIVSEMAKTGSDYVYLDMTAIPNAVKRFPNIYRSCLKRGLDFASDYLPVSPAAHYTMGGIKTSVDGETAISGLYACGEAACTGVHGANRLASNSLLEGIVFGERIARHGEEIMYRRLLPEADIPALWQNETLHVPAASGLSPSQVRSRLRRIMWEQVGILRNEAQLKEANRQVEELYLQLADSEDKVSYWEVINMLTVARITVQAALWRRESRGGHYRTDYPAPEDMRWMQHSGFVNC
ncbi:MAG: L-aspartate oxidase [Syntrophomonadaceae bacterium]|nr:L-aspartate oxidase [Syntrophomonadaceae bacterium]